MTARPLTDKQTIRRLLETDRNWALYALADLDDALFVHCQWWGCGNALALVFHGLAIRPIFVMGDAPGVRQLLRAIPVDSGYLNLQSATANSAAGVYAYRKRYEMHRMILADFTPRAGVTEPLTPAHRDEVEALFATGNGSGIAFHVSQMESGFFRAVREHGTLVAVAGIHVASANEGVAGVGNVFVREDRRGRGFAQVVLSATVAAVRGAGIRTIGLNVERSNAAAIHAYENLGFRTRFSYFEGTADRVCPQRPDSNSAATA
ncbi:MAG: GNAT family N-acetyltransferase [Bryobacteraceae bacterium]